MKRFIKAQLAKTKSTEELMKETHSRKKNFHNYYNITSIAF